MEVSNFILFAIFIVILLPIIPSKWADPLGHDFSQKANFPTENFSIVRIIIKSIIKIFFDLAQTVNLRGSATLLIFGVVGADLYFSQEISKNAVILVCVSVLALYFDQLIEQGEEISFSKFFGWKRRKDIQ